MKKFIKLTRISAVFIALTMIFQLFTIGVVAENIAENEALIVFDKNIKLSNVKGFELKSKTMASPVTLSNGTTVWSFTGTGTEPCAYIGLPDSFENSNVDGSEYDVEITYFDNLTGYVIIYYDSAVWGPQVAYELYATSTDEWKTAKFTLDDAAFDGNIDGKGDLKLSFLENGSSVSKTPFPMLIRSIKVTRKPGENPIFAEAYTDRTGNIFEYYNKTKLVHNNFTNTTRKKQTVNVEYQLVNTENGNIPFSKTESFEVPAKKTVTRDVNINCEICGLYEWKVNILDESGIVTKTFDEDTIAVVKTDPDGIKSEFGWVNSHMERYRPDSQLQLLEVMGLSNVAGYRFAPTWTNAEVLEGSLMFKGDVQGERKVAVLEQALKMGLKVGAYLGYNSSFYNKNAITSDAVHELPDTEEELAAFRNYCDYVIKEFGEYIDIYEVWNEPNVSGFNVSTHNKPVEGAPLLTNITKEIRKSVNKYDPTAKVASVSVTGLHLAFSKEWLNECLKLGIADANEGMNVMALHTYHEKLAPEESKTYELVKWYRKQVEPYGIKDIPVFISEYGVTTPDEYTGIENKTNWIVRDTILFKAHGVGDYMFLYNLEQKGIIDVAREDNFGIVTHPDSRYKIDGKNCVATQPFLSYTAMNYVLGGHVIPDGTWEPGDELYLNRFKSEKWDSNVLTMWSADGEKSLTLDLGTDRVDYYDRYGNKTVVSGENGVFTFVVDERPAYIVGDFSKNVVLNHKPIVEFDEYRATCAEADGQVVINLKANTDKKYTVEAKPLINGAENDKTQLADGKATIKCKMNGELGDLSFIDIYVKDKNRTVAYAQLPVEFIGNVSPSLMFKVKDSSDYDNWDITAEITNYMKGTSLTGYIEFSEPAEFAALGKIDIGEVAPNSKKDVVFNVPELVQKGFRNFTYKIVSEQAGSVEYNERYDLNIATRTKTPVTLDGIASEGEWPKTTYMKADKAENVVMLDDFKWSGAEDKSALASIMWDDENLYIYSEVTDDTYYQDQDAKNSWQCDGMQFGLLVDTGEEAFTAMGQSNTVFNEFAVTLLPDGKTVGTYRHKAQFDRTPVGECSTAKGAVIRRGNKTYYEWSMPWSDIVGIDGWKPELGQKLGFSILWNDNDGKGRKGWIEYASGIGQTKDSKKFTNLEFIE